MAMIISTSMYIRGAGPNLVVFKSWLPFRVPGVHDVVGLDPVPLRHNVDAVQIAHDLGADQAIERAIDNRQNVWAHELPGNGELAVADDERTDAAPVLDPQFPLGGIQIQGKAREKDLGGRPPSTRISS
jgi:hypothetical protein